MIEGRDRIRSWFEFQRQKFPREKRWNFQHRVTSLTIEPSGENFLSQVYLLTTGQKREIDGEIRSFWVPGQSLDHWVMESGEWRILKREIEVAFAAYEQAEALDVLIFSGAKKFETTKRK